MRIGRLIIYPWNKKNFIPRIIAIGLIVSWIYWSFAVWREHQQLEARWAQLKEQQQLREDQQRREAAYRLRLLEEKNARSGVQNIMDGYKK